SFMRQNPHEGGMEVGLERLRCPQFALREIGLGRSPEEVKGALWRASIPRDDSQKFVPALPLHHVFVKMGSAQFAQGNDVRKAVRRRARVTGKPVSRGMFASKLDGRRGMRVTVHPMSAAFVDALNFERQ